MACDQLKPLPGRSPSAGQRGVFQVGSGEAKTGGPSPWAPAIIPVVTQRKAGEMAS